MLAAARDKVRRLAITGLFALSLFALGLSTPALAQQHRWSLTVASWNLLNFSAAKATYPGGAERINLLTRMGAIAGAYDILVFQEVLQDGSSVTQHLHTYLPANYVCNHVTAASGRVGRQERYVVCAPPQNASGAIAITGWTDYSTTGLNYQAADGSQRPAANVWMRPPVIARVTFTPNDAVFQPVTFDIYTNHTKPAYGTSANARPPGTVANAPNASVVHYELQAIENNLVASPNRMLIGDLNADCASYPVRYRGQDFAAWTWRIAYGQRTNTAVGTACAHDRIIMNNGLNAYYQAHGVDYDHYGNATRVDGRRISDHYPVWVRLGQVQNPKPAMLLTSLSVPVSSANAQKKFSTTDTVKATGRGLKRSATAANLYVVQTSVAQNFKSNFKYTLTDVRGAPTPVTTDANGDFTQTVSWTAPPAGAYTLVFDANGDGKFSLADGDFANSDIQSDMLVTNGSAGHNTLVTLGDNMVARNVFDLSQAHNIYALAKQLPVSTAGNLYIVSRKLLKAGGFATWDQARTAHINLADYSIPINRAGDGVITTSQLTPADKRQPIMTTPSGELFVSAWPEPALLMNATVNYQAPPQSVFADSYAGGGDPPASPDVVDVSGDPCEGAYTSADANFKQACNLGFLFSNYYGNTFNIVLSFTSDGTFGPTDVVDVRDTGDMKRYFDRAGSTTLGPNANGDPAVSEYKEYLSRALSVDLVSNNTYDTDTRAASFKYACGGTLSKVRFQSWIVPDAQTGFRVLSGDAYQSERSTPTGLYQYDQAFLGGVGANGSDACVSANDLQLGGDTSIANGSNVTMVSSTTAVHNATLTLDHSNLCMNATQTAATGLAIGVGTLFVISGPVGWVTGGLIALVGVGGSAALGGGACGL